MSIYNGFSTRKQEQDYNLLLEQTLFLLQTYIVKVVKDEKIDENKFTSFFEKLFNTLEQFEAHKYLDPKFSVVLKPLAKALNIKKYTFIEGDPNLNILQKKTHSPNRSVTFLSKDFYFTVKQNIKYNQNVRSSSKNFTSSTTKKTTQGNSYQENKISEVTQSGKWIYQTISEIGNTKQDVQQTSSSKGKDIEPAFPQEQSPESHNNGKYMVQLKTISNRVQVQTPSSYKAFCMMTLSPSPSNTSAIQINESSTIQLKVQKKNGHLSQTSTTIEKKSDEPEKIGYQTIQPYSQTEIVQKASDTSNTMTTLNQNNTKIINPTSNEIEEHNIRLDKVVLQKYGETAQNSDQLYNEDTEEIVQSSRNYNRVYKETNSLSVGRKYIDPINNSYSLSKQNLIVTRNQKKNRLQQQRKILQEEELEASKKDERLMLLENQYSSRNDNSFYSQVNGRHSDLSNHHSLLQNTIEQDYSVNNNLKHQRGLFLAKGSLKSRQNGSKNTSPVNLSNTINYDDTNYYPIKNFQKAIPILKPLYHSVDTGQKTKQGSLSTRESKNSQDLKRKSLTQIQINSQLSQVHSHHNLSNNHISKDQSQAGDKCENGSEKIKSTSCTKVNLDQKIQSKTQPLKYSNNQSNHQIPSNAVKQTSVKTNSKNGRCKSFIYYNNNFTIEGIQNLTQDFSQELKELDHSQNTQKNSEQIKSDKFYKTERSFNTQNVLFSILQNGHSQGVQKQSKHNQKSQKQQKN